MFRTICQVLGSTALVAGWLVAFCGIEAYAQVQERPKSSPKAPSAKAAEAASPTPSWIVACTNTPAGLACRAGQSISFRQGNRNVRVTAALQISPETKKPNLTLQLPLGVYLPPGVSVRFGKEAAKAVAFQSCNPKGCVTEYSPTEAEIASLVKGAELVLSVRTPDKTAFTFKVPATGFDAAYAKMTDD